MRISHIFVTVDIIVLRTATTQELLLIRRANDPFKGSWALPGGFVDAGEDLEAAAIRELQEETGILAESASQFRAFGTPGRDPRGHTVSIVFHVSVDASTVATAGDDAAHAEWFELGSLPELAFDHAEIIASAVSEGII